MRAYNSVLMFGCGLLVVAGCSSVKTDFKAGTDFTRYRTFAMMPLPQSGPPEDPGLMMRVAQPAKEAVVTGLGAKGMFEAPGNEADLEINLKGQAIPKVDVTSYGYTYPRLTHYGTVMVTHGPPATVTTYTERRLIVEMFDNHTKEMVWVGWKTKNSDQPVKAEALQEAIRSILEKYPPKESE
jgi:hypothetical protein